MNDFPSSSEPRKQSTRPIVRILDENGEDEWPDDNFTGIREVYWPNGNLKVRAEFLNGEEEGDFLCVWENGRVCQYGRHSKGRSIGLWIDYRPDGSKLLEGLFGPDGKIGIWSYFHPNGTPSSQEEYHDGIAHGVWKRHDESGDMIYEGEYRNGKPYSGVLRVTDFTSDNYGFLAEFKDGVEIRRLE